MKQTGNIIVGSIILAAAMGSDIVAQSFVPSSVLAEGKWVKVAIKDTGLYEISYDQLSEMGFSDPSKVRIYGQGGRRCNEDFVSATGTILYQDDLRSVPVSHADSRLYFYGLGVDNISFSSADGYFQNNGLNIFTDRGYYFLTDALDGTLIEKAESDGTGTPLSNGFWYAYHEKDLAQGHLMNGQLFWGEDFSDKGVDRMEWDVVLRDPLLNKSGTIALDFYKNGPDELTLQYGLTSGTGGLNKKLASAPNQTYFEAAKPRYASVTPQAKLNKVYVQVPGDRPSGSTRLDYWVFTYKRNIPTLSDGISQDAILFEGVGTGSTRSFTLPSADSRRVFQISDPYNVTEYIPQTSDAGAVVSFTSMVEDPTFLIFDPSMPQLQIEEYEIIGNQNLHAWKDKGVDLAIITTPEMKELAELHADVHRQLQGLEVAVVDCAELYNEFSSGHPDPMAYRAFITMLYNNPERPVKNVLLYGPATGDVRTNVAQGKGDSRLILQQNRKNKIAFDHGASTVYDYYGIVSPTISSNSYETLKVLVGVGYLIVRNETDAKLAREKVERYLSDTTHARYINRMIAVACDGDNHTHEQQAIQITEAYASSNYGATVNRYVISDDNGEQNATDQFFSAIDEGANILQYLGHATLGSIGGPVILSAGQVAQFKNCHLPVMFLAGCDLTLPELQQRGIAERVVLDTPNGAIACISTNRQAWSGPNFELSTEFLKKWGYDNGEDNKNCQPLESPRTLGEQYAIAKTNVKNANELAFLLIGDPAIPLASANRKVDFNVNTAGKDMLVAGHKADIAGQILTHNGNLDTNFNGEVVIRLMEPIIPAQTRDFITNCGSSVEFNYDNFQAAEIVSEVKNGKFSVSIPVPAYMAKFNGKEVRIVSGAYAADTRIGAAGVETIAITSAASAGMSEPVNDTQAPQINGLAYDPSTNMMIAQVSDNIALSTRTSPLYAPSSILKIDGKDLQTGRYPQISTSPDGTSAEYSFILPELSYGPHTALLCISDQAGNIATEECRFTINPGWSTLLLSTREGVADDKITFSIEGATDNKLKLIITDNAGNEVFSQETGDTEIVWNCLDKSGNRVSPGLYKAFVRENGRTGYRGHSETIQVPVI